MTADAQKNGGAKPKLDFTTFDNVINGKLVNTTKTRHNINPSTLEPNPEVPIATLDDVNEAVKHARTAAKGWATTPLADRRQAILNLAAALRETAPEFARMLTKEQGKPLSMALGEAEGSSQLLEQIAKLPFDDDIVEDSETHVVKTRYVPLGVAVAIVPWNFPHNLACIKLGHAVVTGNTVIIKPSPFTPYCNLKLAELAQQFFPPGVVQALSGDDSLGPWLTEHEGVDKVSFTGSTATGRLVMKSCAKTLKRVTLELGGNDAAIGFEDVDVADTAAKLAQFAFINSGQICIAVKRIYVHASIYPQFLEAFVATTKSLRVGDGMTEGVFLGPVQNKMQYDRISGLLKDVQETKGTIAFGGNDGADGTMGKGYFIQPTVVDNPPDTSRIVMEEPFGPIVPLLEFDTEEEAITRANSSDYGLGGSVWSKDLPRAERVASQLQAGNIWVNSHMVIRPDAPVAGHKQSGIGVEFGTSGLRGFCNPQTITVPKA
ncbi:aldehyde dehydrogenase [Microdochium bolleyi]|uniref:aldehyde dehydrogenase (NAD(+)) n=1 Tax=Microdochium bolleyi TaxID=196109 RepID=A0A136IU37_9PEZI|nr:aldehyde dehydrogenase [Microdochium bolleyi]